MLLYTCTDEFLYNTDKYTYFFSILVYSNYSLIVYHIVLFFYRGVCKSGKDPEIWHPCRLIYVEQDVEAMFRFCPWHAHLHKSKMAAVGHLEFLTFVKLTLEPHVTPHF